MEKKFKTFVVKKTGEFGIIDYISSETHLMIGTSAMPQLFGNQTTMYDVKKYYNDKPLDVMEDLVVETFDFDKHIGDKWKLVTVTLSIGEE